MYLEIYHLPYFPLTVEYTMPDHDKSLSTVINGLADWGIFTEKIITGR